jgi:hypothetical protein
MIRTLTAGLFISAICGCATTAPQPLSYLSSEKPQGIIRTEKPQDIKKSFSRGGWYAMNLNFRPAADLQSYLDEAQKVVNIGILRNTDVQLNVPFAFDLLFCGYNMAHDTLVVTSDTSKPSGM